MRIDSRNTRQLSLAPNQGTTSMRAVVAQGERGEQGLPGNGSAAWTASTAVTTGTTRQAPDGSWIKATASRTTRSSFDATEQGFWKTLSETPGTLEAAALSATTTDLIGRSLVTAPEGFDFTSPIPYAVYRTQAGLFVIDIDIASLKPAAGVTYYISPSGSSGNTGLSAASPIRLQDAIGKSDVGTIRCATGEYFQNTHQAGKITKSLNIIGDDGAILTTFRDPSSLTWTLHSGNIYKTTRSVTVGVVDKRSAYIESTTGDYPLYVQVASLAALTGAGMWYTDGTTVYVWALGNANLVTDASFMRLNLDTGAGVLNMEGAFTLYIENTAVEGGGTSSHGSVDVDVPSANANRPRLVMVDSPVRYSAGKGVKTTGAELAVIVRTRATTSTGDGLSHHSATRSGTKYKSQAIEIDAVARLNGQSTNTSENDNCFTSHDECRVIRINPDGSGSYGPLYDEDGGAKSWNLGAKLGTSRAPTRFWQACASTGSGAEMWFEGASFTATPGKAALNAYDATSKVHTRRGRTGSLLAVSKNASAAGVIDTY